MNPAAPSPSAEAIPDERVAHLVEEIAKMLSGAPFPSARSYAKAREVVELFISSTDDVGDGKSSPAFQALADKGNRIPRCALCGGVKNKRGLLCTDCQVGASPSDSSIAQAFREMADAGGTFKQVYSSILDRARKIDVSAPAAAVGGDGLDFEPDDNHTVSDMANVGYSLMQAIKRNLPDYCWNESPAEIVSDLLNQVEEAKATPAAPVGGFVVVPEEVKTAALLLDMGLKFALCHRDFGDTRNAIKNLQKESQIIYDWTKAGREVCERCNGTRVMVSDNHDEAECTHCATTGAGLVDGQCEWTFDDMWESACGVSWEFTNDGPAENNYRFCHGCGKPIKIVEAAIGREVTK